MRYDGEKPLHALVSGTPFSGVKNLVYPGPGGKIIENPVAPLDLAKLPPADYTLVSLEAYFRLQPAHSRGTLPFASQRGCKWAEGPGRCIFCSIQSTGGLRAIAQAAAALRMADLAMEFMHEGTPRIAKKAVWSAPKYKSAAFPAPQDLTPKLLEVLADFNVCSKEAIIRRYDHEVQGGSVVKPLAGPACDGPGDASVLCPRLGSFRGIAVSNGINPRLGMIDPYWMAASAVDEAVRQIIAVGGDLSEMALLDNFCWGNPDKPDRLGGLVRAAKGCHDFAVAYGTPFISGKDSFYNEYNDKGKSIAIPGTILISAIGIVKDVRKSVTMDLKRAGNLLYVAGPTYDEWGASAYLASYGLVGGQVPVVRAREALALYGALSKATVKGLVASIHDCSEGGLAVAVAEMAFAGGLGAAVLAKSVPYEGHDCRDDMLFFSESNSRFVLEVDPRNKKRFEKMMKGVPCGLVGQVLADDSIFYYGLKDNLCLKADIHVLKEAWKKPLMW